MTVTLSRKTGRARRAFLRDERSARSLVRVVRKAFRQESKAVQRAARGTSWDEALRGAIRAVDEKRWVRVLEIIYTEAATGNIWKETQQALGVETDDDVRATILEHMRPAISTKAAGIVQTTTKALRRLEPPPLKATSEGGLMRRAAAGLYQRFGTNRAARIAVTETLQAAATVQHLAAKSVARVTRAQIFKVWESVGDAVVRETHIRAHGQRRPLDQPFDVGFSQLDHPRDPYGPPAEVANCRCWTTHEKVGGVSPEAGQVTLDPAAAALEEELANELRQQGFRIRDRLTRFRERQTYRRLADPDAKTFARETYGYMDEAAEARFGISASGPGNAEELWKQSLMNRHGSKLRDQFDTKTLLDAEGTLRRADSSWAVYKGTAAEDISANLIKTWANTSGDENPVSLSMQRKIATLFDTDWPPKGYRLPARVLDEVDDLIADPAFNKVLDAFVRNVYDETQQLLEVVAKDYVGVDSWPMFRGGDFGDLDDRVAKMLDNQRRRLADPIPEQSPPWWVDRDTGERIATVFDEDAFQFVDDFNMNPGSSFSLRTDTAAEFASEYAGTEYGQVLIADIPIEKVWSTPFTGPGCYGEAEMIVGAGADSYELSWTWWRQFVEAVGSG